MPLRTAGIATGIRVVGTGTIHKSRSVLAPLQMTFLGAHVSTSGGVHRAPERGEAIGATAIQVFTKTPSQWREPVIADAVAAAFDRALQASPIRAVVAHDSYLINLASPDPDLHARSMACFEGELRRCAQLGIPYVVTHPGNYITDRNDGLRRNAAAYARCLDRVEGPMILIETTAGSGTALGSRFDELATLRGLVPAALHGRVGFCADTCHLYAGGYDLRDDWDAVWDTWDATIGLQHLVCLHLNDSKTAFSSRRDRHELIGKGTLGTQPFRRIMQDPRFSNVVKVIETPKGTDPIENDTRMLRLLRRLGEGQ